MNKLIISIPQFNLSGGNLVSLELGLFLKKKGLDVYGHSGFRLKKIDEIELNIPKRGLCNTIINIISFFCSSFYSLFSKYYIATHHLTSLFNFIKPAKFSLIQDIESLFYPKRLSWFGTILWRNYLKSDTLLYTSKYLEQRIHNNNNPKTIGFPFIKTSTNFSLTGEKIYDALMILRDGDYKNYNLTLSEFYRLNNNGFTVALVNASRNSLPFNPLIFSNLRRDDFIKVLMMSKRFICLSKWEGLGLPNLEAYSLGLEIISTKIPSAQIIEEIDPNAITIIDSIEQVEKAIISNRVQISDNKMYLRSASLTDLDSLWKEHIFSTIRYYMGQ
ncbi:hypothetical protein ACYTKI_001776 [Escherichia albertii]|uniref:hypothetical protein n=1 Tax=Escherichia albertii TaxID=208962 RepID=UPI001A135B5A|nr:hypothetical protein [Escherichia albertii]MCZ8956638.1 hypothetical protein [Escherichia albertii]QTA11503.1 hypothetical protein FYK20_11415 [Escherichia albertii]